MSPSILPCLILTSDNLFLPSRHPPSHYNNHSLPHLPFSYSGFCMLTIVGASHDNDARQNYPPGGALTNYHEQNVHQKHFLVVCHYSLDCTVLWGLVFPAAVLMRVLGYFPVVLILRPIFCVMCSYKFSQYDTTASILMFMKCISSTSETEMAVNFKARWKARSRPRRSASGNARLRHKSVFWWFLFLLEFASLLTWRQTAASGDTPLHI